MMRLSIQYMLLVCLLFISINSNCATFTWTGNSSNNWTVGSNWQGGSAPNSSTDDIVIPSVAMNPRLYGSISVNSISIATGMFLYNLNGHSITVGSGGITGAGTLECTTAVVTCGGNFTINSFVQSGCTLILNCGASGQSIAQYTVNNLEVNATGTVTLNPNITLAATNSFTFTAGKIAGSNAKIRLGTNSTSRGTFTYTGGHFTTAAFERWFSPSVTLGNNAGLFPMGTGTDKRFFYFGGSPVTGGTIKVTYTNATGATTYGTSYTDNSGNLTVTGCNNSKWVVVTANSFDISSANIRLEVQNMPGVNSLSDITIANLTGSAVGGSFNTPSGTTSSFTIDRTGLSFSDLNNKTFTIGGNLANSPLPVKLISFDAKAQGNKSLLYWSTATEENNRGFYVERSFDGINWDEVNFVPSLAPSGNSQMVLDYFYSDTESGLSLVNGIYYRLRQQDFNGKEEYVGGIKLVTLSYNLPKIVIYPNPTNNYFNVHTGNELIILQLINSYGQVVIKETVNGFSRFDTESLSAGIYTISISSLDGDIVKSERLVVY